jgi:RimJ/RimL family protein N-acetyltransferase
MKKTELRAEGHPCWLRPCEESDGPGIYAAAAESIERVGRWMGWLTKAYSPSDSTDWAKAAGADWGHGSRYEFVIIDTLCGEICGCCGLNRINQEDLVCNLGYWVRESKTRRGIATAAARLLMSFGLQVLGLQRIEVVVADGNTSSRGVAEKLGAHYEGLQRMRLRVGGVSHDAHMYALLAWRDQKPNKTVVDNRLPAPSRNDPLDYNP